jgi:hypothetical protein
MTRLLDRPLVVARQPGTVAAPQPEGPWIDSTPAAEHLRQHCAAVRLQLRWWGTSRTLSARQKSDLINDAGVDARFLRASKQIIDRAHPTLKLLTGIRGRITGTWRRLGLPFVEPGVRLIPRPLIPEFEQAMEFYRQELAAGVEELAEVFPGLLEAARDRLGRFFNPEDYPTDVRELFTVAWEYPSIEPPSYLLALDPGLYRRELKRAGERLDQALELAQSALTEEFGRLVEHLAERLTDAAGGRPKTFRDSSLENLLEFFGRFRQAGLRGGEDLDRLVGQAQDLVRGIRPNDLRQSEGLRERIAGDLARVGRQLETLMVDRPRRRIVRTGAGATTPAGEAVVA